MRRPPQSMEATLADAFGQPEGASYAAFRLLGEARTPIDVGTNCWVNADPVHLRFHQEQVVLAAPSRSNSTKHAHSPMN